MLVFARHGECVANTERRYVGRGESTLTARGERQAGRMAAVLAEGDLDVARIVTSPLVRALRTAEIVAAALERSFDRAVPVEVDERFVELDYGELDGEPIIHGLVGMHPSGVSVAWRDDPAVALPKGESVAEVADRVFDGCAELYRSVANPGAASGQGAGRPNDRPAVASAVVVVSHVVPIKLAVCWALGIPVSSIWRMDLAVASLTRVSTAGAMPHLERFNEHGFLSEDRSPPIWR
jgi:broad specificity phosphatase PhoE